MKLILHIKTLRTIFLTFQLMQKICPSKLFFTNHVIPLAPTASSNLGNYRSRVFQIRNAHSRRHLHSLPTHDQNP